MKNITVEIKNRRNKINTLRNSAGEKVCLLEDLIEHPQEAKEKDNITINQEIRRTEIKVLLSS